MAIRWRNAQRGLGRIVLDVGPPLAMTVFLLVVGPLAARLGHDRRPIGTLDLGLLAAAGVSLFAWRRFPLLAYWASVAFTVAFLVLGHESGPILLAPFAAVMVLAATQRARIWLPSAIAGAVILAVALAAGFGTGFEVRWPIFGLVWIVLPALVGVSVRARRAFVEEQRAREQLAARTSEAEALQRMAEERLRIAREVHDVVGHSLAVISLQAGVAEHLLNGHPQEVRKAVTAIRAVSKEALGQLRVELAALRGEASAAPGPAPSADLSAIPDLVSSMREAGLAVDLRVEGDETVPEPVATAAYRIVQESLTNVARHAGAGAHARVRVVMKPDVLEVEVLDDGSGRATVRPHASGLHGMRERAAALGGRFEAGNLKNHGFRVWAELPLRAE